MNLPYRFTFAWLALAAFPVCGHAPPPIANPSPAVENEATGFGPGGAPLPDARYGFHPLGKNGRTQTLEVSQGRITLTSPNAVTLDVSGKGPLWHLASPAAGKPNFAADLLVVDGDHGWIRTMGSDQAIEFARIREVPLNLRGKWRVVREIGPLKDHVSSLELSPSGGIFAAAKGDQKIAFPAAWLQSRGDQLPAMLVDLKEQATLLTMVRQKGLLALAIPNEELALFTDDLATVIPALTLERLQSLKPIYFTGRQAYDLKCGQRGCDLLELDESPSPIHLSAVEKTGIALRLRQEKSSDNDVILVPMNQRLLAAGMDRDALALVPLAPTAIPPSLIGAWKTTSVFAPGGFDLAEIQVGRDGVATTRLGKKPSRAFIVQTAFDDGLLLLEHGSGDRQWNLWRFTQGRDRWYLSPWTSGAGPLALWQGSTPAWIPSRDLQNTPSGGDHPATTRREGETPGEPPGWKNLDNGSKKAATAALNAMWLGAVVFYEGKTASGANAQTPFRFPGKASYRFTPDRCRPSGAIPSATTWQSEPWSSLNFAPPDKAAWMGFDFIADGEGRNAHFVAIVAIDSDCSGKPVYAWRRGHLNDTGDVEGAYVPRLGNEPPALNAPETDK